jgi:penicillin-binding protein 1A
VVEGGSSITQQLAKQLFLTSERTLRRKIKELILTLQIERKYSKDEILEMYFNQIYFGHRAYGIESAAQVYFGKTTQELTLAECALLAGLPKAPNRYSPFKNPKRAKRRQILVAERLWRNKFITFEELEEIKNAPLALHPAGPKYQLGGYFIEYVRQYLEKKYDPNLIYGGGLRVYTTLNCHLQMAAEEAVRRKIDELKKEGLQGSLIAISPKTGHIKAMVGGYRFSSEDQFNRATQARRQPGSSFKLFTYLAALDHGFTPASIIFDSPVIFEKEDGEHWIPRNYEEEKFAGPVTLRQALARSINVVAVKLLDRVGITKAIDYARKMGIKSYLGADLSLTLGAYEVTNLEMTSAYATLVNQGIYVSPLAIIRVEDRTGQILENNFPEEKVALSPQTAYLMISLLESAVKEGTCWYARRLRRPVAAKTGTTNDFTDAWFFGLTPQLVAGVWIGFDQKKTLGEKMAGGVVAAPVWTWFMKKALENEPILDFPAPEGIISVKVDEKTGLLATPQCQQVIIEIFKRGTEPRKYCSCQKEIG